MSDPDTCPQTQNLSLPWRTVALGLLLAVGSPVVAQGAQEPRQPVPQPRVAAAKSLSPDNALLSWSNPTQGWKGVESLGTVYTTDLLLTLPGDRAAIKNPDGSLQLTLCGNLPQLSP